MRDGRNSRGGAARNCLCHTWHDSPDYGAVFPYRCVPLFGSIGMYGFQREEIRLTGTLGFFLQDQPHQAHKTVLSGRSWSRSFFAAYLTNATSVSPYHRHRFPAEIISHSVWLYFRFALSFRDVEEMLAMRGVVLSYETIREWCLKFGQPYANDLRRRSSRPGDQWHLDQVFLKTNWTHSLFVASS